MHSYYLNTDFLLVASTDLSPLAEAWKSLGEMLFCVKGEDGKWHATFEAAGSAEHGRTPLQDIEGILQAIDSLPLEHARLLTKCESRELNIGWQSAEQRPEGSFQLPARILAAIAAAQIDLAATVYPSCENDLERDPHHHP
jgi:hypothetical protein